MSSKTDPGASILAFEQALIEIPVFSPPPSLFRFSGASGGISALRDLTLKLTRPKDFNDPFEILPGIAVTDLTDEAVVRSLTAANGLWRKAMTDAGHKITDEAEFLSRATAEVRRAPAKKSLHARSMIDAVADSFRRYLGVCCFSAFSPNDLCGALGIRHWSSYADHHRGIVIEYDGHHRHFQDLARQKLCFPVEYCPSRTQVGLKELEIWDDATMWRYMRTWTALKSRLAWGEEKEWRMIAPLEAFLERGFVTRTSASGQELYLLQLLHGVQDDEVKALIGRIIRRVIFGVRTNQDVKDEVFRALKEPHLKHVQVAEASMSPSDFALEITQIRE
jgi:hypothetical protein